MGRERLIVFAFLKCTDGGMRGFNHVCVCILLQQDCVGVYSLNMRVIHGSGSSSGICTVINHINNIDMTWIFEVILGAVFFLSDF